MKQMIRFFTTAMVALACSLCASAQDDTAREREIYGAAETFFKQGQFADVLKELLKLPDNRRRAMPIEAYYWFGVSWYETGEWSFSQWYLLRSASEHPSAEARFDARTRLAQIARRVGELERATDLLTQALEDSPRERDFLKTALLVGELQQLNRNYDAALLTYAELLKAFPELAAARTQRLWALYRAERFEQCLQESGETMQKVPVQDRAEVSYLMAASHRALGQFAKAVELYEQLLQTFPFGRLAEDARYELALCHYENREFGKAVRSAEAVLRGNPSRADRLRFLWLLADAQAHQSQWQTAKDIYRQIAESSADRATSALALEQMIEMAKRQNRAREVEELTRLLKEKYSSGKK
jgi:tetratricopeptide (TPR) repeat protein